MMTTRGTFGLALLCFAFGCSGEAEQENHPDPAPWLDVARSDIERTDATEVPVSEVRAVAAANNAFAVDLYSKVLKQAPDANVLTSPISASLALSMAMAGAVGRTKAEMAQVLHLDTLEPGAAFAGQNALSQGLGERAARSLAQDQTDASLSSGTAPNPADYDLKVVNSVWGERTYQWQRPFLEILAANYGTGVQQQDFRTGFSAARVQINDWVSASTNDKINELLPDGALDDMTRLVLVNALHLKLPWETAFDESATRPAKFTRADATKIETAFMNAERQLAYADDGQAQIVSIPLNNREISVVITLPHDGVGLADYEAALTPTSEALLGPKSSELVALSLPKVKFTTPSFSLGKALKALGMTTAFDRDAADLTGMAVPQDGEHLYVAEVLQKATIGIDESGVEAAAATAVLVAGNTSAPVEPPKPVPMTVNRPYLVTIVDNPTGTVLMLGHIQDPSQSGEN